MGTYSDLVRPIADGLVALGEQLDADMEGENVGPPVTGSCSSGVYTGDTDGNGSAERDFGEWRGREVEAVLTFTPDDKWDPDWWVGQFGGDYPYRDRLVITRGLCLNGESVDSPLSGTPFADLASAARSAGITSPIYRLGHEFNGDWYPWKVKGHETTWRKRFELAAAQIHDADPDARVMICTAAGKGLDWFDWPDADAVDMYSVDLYDRDNQIGQWSEQVDMAREFGSAVSVPEWGLWATPDGEGDNPAYIDAMADLFASSDCAGGLECYFNKNSSSVHVLSSYPNGEERYLERFGG